MTNYDIIPAEDATDATPSDSTHTVSAVGVRSGLGSGTTDVSDE